jgi:hypothetical protein
MNKWITDRLPTENDADENGHVWITDLDGGVILTGYGWVYPHGVPWMAKQKIVPPDPYVKPEPKRWKPQYGDEYYAIKSSGLIAHSIFHNGLSEDCTYNFGNCFETREQAVEAARRVRETLLNYHKELNDAA